MLIIYEDKLVNKLRKKRLLIMRIIEHPPPPKKYTLNMKVLILKCIIEVNIES